MNSKIIKVHNFDAQKIRKKLQIVSDLFDFAYNVKKDQLRKKYPQLSERELNHKAYEMIERGCR